MLVEHRSQQAVNAGNSPVQVLPPWPLDGFLARHGMLLARDDDRRHFARLYYRRPACFELTTTLPAFVRRCESINTYSCDISREGIAFLSPYELYPREVIALKIDGLSWKQLVVVRCRRLAKCCFEIGAKGNSADNELPTGL